MAQGSYEKERANRVRRIKLLRRAGTVKWVIKTEQASMALIRKGLDPITLFSHRRSKLAQALLDKHVIPLMGQEEQAND